jgi:electron transport complex protein RnfC
MGTFKGGVHPPAHKEMTQHLEVQPLGLPPELIVPLAQHIGAPARAIVSKGDEVLKGQMIAEAGGFVSSALHAPASGKVKAIEKRPHPTNMTGEAIVIEPDGDDRWAEGIGQQRGWESMSADDLRSAIQSAGICGMGGAAFPTHVKLSPPKDKPIDTLILNGVECEPYLTADHRMMLESPDTIIEGLRIIQKILGVKTCYIGIEENKPDAIELMRQKVDGSIGVISLHVKYPQGAEKQLIKAITGREVPPGGLPMDVGAVVQNVGTAHAVYEAVTRGIPLIERVATVTGHGVNNPANLRIRIGTPVEYLLDQCGGLAAQRVKVIMGGPMMGIAQHNLKAPAVKGTSGLLVFPEEEVFTEPQGPCIRCARCVDACPMSITPCHIAQACEYDRFDEAQYYGMMDCIECGSCTYVCPTRRHLVQYIKYGKRVVLARRAAARAKKS